ncbi:RNA polymerase sigma factor [Microbacterium ureisolvens]|uniref:Sigma-70 family RNA polymerase sigma factor n=1 Tax=Microbacterium ureisolvens TaxID=2781186 RepID=A0ABS7I1W0_9MICO|nr:sigma-70 family RNA polymerase sigma factor [Microbacterium ureisolvens]MBW9111303.1 sigma-70 family RNA polymerase sigma factor [Microbacterium ureisolvens]
MGLDRANSSASRVLGTSVVRAFDDLFRAYHSLILTAAFNRLNDLGDAEDVTAEVFSAAWRHRGEHELVFTLRWLYATLRNVVGNEYRRRARTARRYQRLAAEATESTVLAVDDEAIMLRQIVSRLRPEDRELIWMAYWEELTREEMAEVLGCSVGAVKVRLLRARERLKSLLETREPVGDERGVP